jgi:hypothetical protein
MGFISEIDHLRKCRDLQNLHKPVAQLLQENRLVVPKAQPL